LFEFCPGEQVSQACLKVIRLSLVSCGNALPPFGYSSGRLPAFVLYLDFPQLKRLIVISEDKVAMEPTLDEAIQSVFGTGQPMNPTQAPGAQPELGQARAQFDEAEKALQQGN
jgi:hypothetical protein